MAEQAREKLEASIAVTKVSAHFFIPAEEEDEEGSGHRDGWEFRTAGNGTGYYKAGTLAAAVAAAAAAAAHLDDY